MANENVMSTNEAYLKMTSEQKRRELDSVLAAKAVELGDRYDTAVKEEAVAAANAVRNKDAWTTGLGLDQGSVASNVVNLAASSVYGLGRSAGHLASVVANNVAAGMDANTPDAVLQAYNRLNQGKETDADRALLKAKPTNAGALDPQTNIERLFQIENTRGVGRKINNLFDFNSIVQQGNRDGVNKTLEEAQPALDVLTDSNASLWDRTKALGSAVATAGKAAVENPMGAAEYIAENAPQILVGGAGTKGAAALAGSNLGYAMDEYSKGMENRLRERKDLPLSDERGDLLLRSAAVAAAEQAGEMLQMGVGKLMSSAASKTAKAGFKGGFLGTVKEGALGALGEAATEGFQTYQEQILEGRPVTAMETFKGAAIGAMAGGGMAAGMHAAGAMAAPSEQAQAEQTKKVADATAFAQAMETKDVEPLLDPSTPEYNPAIAVGALHQMNLAEDADLDSKVANFDKASEVIQSLSDRRNELTEQAKAATPAEQKVVQAELQKLHLQEVDTYAVWNKMFDELNKQVTEVPAQEQVKQANTSVESATPVQVEEAKTATNNVINLSMASTSQITPEQAEELATNPNNGLDDNQRQFLRNFSEARQAYNQAQTVGSVSKAVMVGDANNMGIAKYRDRIAVSLNTGNEAKATSDLALLSSFATSHTGKAEAAAQALQKFGDGAQVMRTDTGWSIHPQGTFKKSEVDKNGGIYMTKPKLVKAIQAEAKAVEATRLEMNSAVALKFGASIPSAVVESNPSQNIPASSQNLSIKEMVEEEARLKEIPSEQPETPSPQTKENDNIEVPANADTSTVLVPPSPESAPITSVADAPYVQDTDSAALGNPQTQASTTSQAVQEMTASEQEAIEQQAEAPAEAQVAESAPAIEAMAEKAPEGSEYRAKKLGDFFTQGNTILAKAKDFLTSTKSPKDVASMLGLDGFTPEQSAAVRSFFKHAKTFKDMVSKNLVKGDPLFNYTDGMKYFIRENGDIEENVKTALSYAAFSYIAENFGGKGYNTNSKINAILGREKDTYITERERELFGQVLASQPAVIDALGQRVIKALGVEALKSTPVNELPRLQVALGAHALRILTDGTDPLMKMSFVTNAELTAIKTKTAQVVSDEKVSTLESPVFLSVNRTEDRLPTEIAQDILASVRGSQGVINNLFSIAATEKPPTFEPVKKSKSYAKRTDQLVPKFMMNVLDKLNKQPNFIRQDKVQIADVLGRDRFLKAMGVTTVDGSVHAAKRESEQARNDGLEREFDNIMEFINSYMEGDLTKPFYFEHYAMKQQRAGIANSMVNPQLSKIHRFMVYRQSWETTVDMTDQAQMENFVLRAAEGLGIKTEQLQRDAALGKFKEVFNKPEIKAGIDALNKIEAGQDLTDAEKDAIVTAVGGHAAHGLDTLVGLAAYDRASKSKATTFKANMLSEVDGVTNGPMLSHLLMGAAASVDDLFAMLNRGGFYKEEGAQFNDWRSAPSHEDLYQTTTAHTLKTLAAMTAAGDISAKRLAPIMAFMGKLEDPVTKAVLKAGRDMIKTPLTAMVYGSTVKKAIEGMAGDFINNIYKQIETTYAKLNSDPDAALAEHTKTIQALRQMGMDVDPKLSVSEMMEMQFTSKEEETLINEFKDTLGLAVEATVNQDFESLLTARKEFNGVASVTFDMFNAAYTGLRNQLVAELVESGEIDATENGVPRHDLTPAQEDILAERIAKITPTLQTAMSRMSGDAAANTGMLVAKTEMQPSDTMAYKAQVKFATVFKDYMGKTSTSLKVVGRHEVNVDPGVGLGATSTHSFDSAVAHSAIDEANRAGMEIINLHDAGGTGIHDLVEQGHRMNKAVWERALTWSPTSEMFKTFMSTVRGMEALINDKNTPQEVLTELAKSLVAKGNKNTNPATLLITRAIESKELAFKTDSIKLGAMAEMGTIAQYAVEGGQYDVTDKDRATAASMLSGLEKDLTKAEIDSVLAVQNALKDHIELAMREAQAKPVTVKTSDIGKLGKPAVESDVKLVNFFSKQPVRSIAEVAQFLKGQNLTGFQDKLLSALVKSLGNRATNYSVNYLTKTSKMSEVLEAPTVPSHAWFVSKEAKNAIYVLSPDFKESGLTVETLLHEMTHAAVAHAIDQPTEQTRPFIEELESIRQKAMEVAYDGKLNQFQNALGSVQELVAYGMTNLEFQSLLDSFAYTSKNSNNSLISGLKAFINTLVGLVFGRQNDSASTGMTALFTNVSALMAVSAKNNPVGNINQSMAVPSLASLRGEEMYDALAALGTTQVSPEFDVKLRAVMNEMEESVHSPMAALKEAALQAAAQTPAEMWDKMKTLGLVDFAKGALASGFHFTEQEAFAQQQVEATVRTALTAKDGSSTAIYRELDRLYREVRQALKGRVNAFNSDPVQAQALYDFVFKMEANRGDMSDYLSRFAALGLTNEQFSKLLDFNTDTRSRPLAGMTFSEKLHEIFDRILGWVNAKATNTYGGQKADTKLNALVNQLVNIEQRKRMKLSQSLELATDTFEKVFRNGFNSIRTGVNNVATSNFFKANSNGVLRLAGKVTSIVATERVNQYLDSLQSFRDQTIRGRIGIFMGLVNEARGSTDMNQMFYKLMRLSKHIEGTRKDIITNTKNFVLESFKDAGEYLDAAMKRSLSYGLLRTDVAALTNDFNMTQIRELFDDTEVLKQAIDTWETKLNGFTHAQAYRNGSKALAVYMATNEIGAHNVRLNPENIAAMLNTEHAGQVSVQEVADATKVIDTLTSLYAISYLSVEHTSAMQKVFKEEGDRTDGGNGIQVLLAMHKDLQEQSKDRLFQGADALRMKGYTPEIYNPYIRLEVANHRTDGKALEERGYEAGHNVQMDQTDPELSVDNRIYVLRDGGMIQHLTGIFSYTGQNRRGSATHNGNLGLLSVTGLMNRNKMAEIQANQANAIKAQSNRDIDPQEDAKNNNYLVPVFNANGEVVNYRYMMNAMTKDDVLERTNDFDELMGVMAGSIYDKEVTKTQNETAVQALYDQYKLDFAKNAGSYLDVGPNSSDKEARETWALLPEATKESVRKIWGTNSMKVRYDMLDINFGYRKNSASTPFGIPEDERNNFQQAYVQLLESFMGKKAGLYVRRTEDVWQALVREAKDTLVVKSGMTLLGNFTSNITLLIWAGVPMKDIWNSHQVALKGIAAYRKESVQLDALEQAVRLNQLNGRDPAEVKREIVRLKDVLARNPVKELVDAGMMPTIVEDVAGEVDKYSYKTKAVEKVNGLVQQLNPQVLKVGKFIAMAHDTPLYQALSYGTQVSDFVARYTLYQHVQKRAKNPLSGDKALQLVSDAFVNYDIPSHRDVQYANDMGLVYFTKYYLRIQKVIAMLYRDEPGRAMMLLTLGHFLDFIPMITHSAALQRVGNPFSTGALESLTSLDELLTVQALMSPFR